MGKFLYPISTAENVSNFDTKRLFDNDFVHSKKSAIDDFVEKRKSLFALLKPYEDNIEEAPNDLKNMILLGCISAVESYIRKIIRTVINVDKISRENCEGEPLKYGAALSHSDENMLPEALLEGYSFTNGKNIRETINKLLKINCATTSLNVVLKDFSKICQLRHCVVHRFGLLGSHNAIELGLADHKQYLEKPLQIDFENLNVIVRVCENLVKVLNNHLFSEIIERTYKERTIIWSSDYRRDKKFFKSYFDLFNDTSVSRQHIVVYKDFISKMHTHYGKEHQTNGQSS